MAERIVVSLHLRVDAAATSSYLRRALAAKKRAEALGATLSAWGAESFAFDFGSEGIEEAVDLALATFDDPMSAEPRFSAGVAFGELTRLGIMGPLAMLAWGEPLLRSARLARLAEPGEVLFDERCPATVRQTVRMSGDRRFVDGTAALALDVRQPFRRDTLIDGLADDPETKVRLTVPPLPPILGLARELWDRPPPPSRESVPEQPPPTVRSDPPLTLDLDLSSATFEAESEVARSLAQESLAPASVSSEVARSLAQESLAPASGSSEVARSLAQESLAPASVSSEVARSLAQESLAPVSLAPESVTVVSLAPVSAGPVSAGPVSAGPASAVASSVAPASLEPATLEPGSLELVSRELSSTEGASVELSSMALAGVERDSVEPVAGVSLATLVPPRYPSASTAPSIPPSSIDPSGDRASDLPLSGRSSWPGGSEEYVELAAAARQALLKGNVSELERLSDELKTHGGEHGDLAERMAGFVAWNRGAKAEGLRKLRAAADAETRPAHRVRALLAYGVALAASGRTDAALLAALGAIARAREVADRQGEHVCARFLARLSSAAGYERAARTWALVAEDVSDVRTP